MKINFVETELQLTRPSFTQKYCQLCVSAGLAEMLVNFTVDRRQQMT